MQDRPVPTEAEKWELQRKRSAPTQPMEDLYEEVDEDDEDVQFAGKGPVYRQVDVEDDVEDEGEEMPIDEPEDAHDNLPNLHEYFQHFDIPDEKVISMCRAYASYLSSLRPKPIKSTSAYATPRRRSRGADQEPPSQKARYWEAKNKKRARN